MEFWNTEPEARDTERTWRGYKKSKGLRLFCVASVRLLTSILCGHAWAFCSHVVGTIFVNVKASLYTGTSKAQTMTAFPITICLPIRGAGCVLCMLSQSPLRWIYETLANIWRAQVRTLCRPDNEKIAGKCLHSRDMVIFQFPSFLILSVFHSRQRLRSCLF